VVVVVRVTTLVVALVVDSMVVRLQVLVGQQVMAARRRRVMLWVLDEACKVLAHPSMLVAAVVVTGVVAFLPETMSVAAVDPVGPVQTGLPRMIHARSLG
jgi:hypothetical protein